MEWINAYIKDEKGNIDIMQFDSVDEVYFFMSYHDELSLVKIEHHEC